MFEQIVGHCLFADGYLPVFEKLLGLAFIEKRIVVAFLDVFGGNHVVCGEQIVQEVIGCLGHLFLDRIRGNGCNIQNIEQENGVIGNGGTARFGDNCRMGDIAFV